MTNKNNESPSLSVRGIFLKIVIPCILLSLIPSCRNNPEEKSDKELWKQTRKICENNIILDSHIDWPEWILDNPEDISGRTRKGDFDLERAREGGLSAALSVIYINTRFSADSGRIMVDSMLKLVTGYPNSYPGMFALARTPDDIKKNFRKKLFSLPLCLENGSPIGSDLGYLKYLKEKGIVYITINHSRANQISDSNFDPDRKWNGLSPFGREVIKEMNRLGIIIDISHSTDSTVFQTLRFSKAPIVATHSSCRYFTPGYERNLSDTLIRAIAKKNGVIMINFGSMFLDSTCNKNCYYLWNWFDSNKVDLNSKKAIDFAQEFGKTHRYLSNSKELVDHIDHIVKIAGIDYVGLGSDFDGIGFTKPVDIPDVSTYPVIVHELLKRGYTEGDISKILSKNFLRVWDEVIKNGESMR